MTTPGAPGPGVGTGHDGSPRVSPQQAVAPIGEEQPSVAMRRGMFGVQDSGDTTGFGGLVRQAAPKTSTPTPYGGYFDDVAAALERTYPSYAEHVTRVVVDRGQITFHVAPEAILDLCALLRDDPALRFELCSSVSGVHYPQDIGHELHAVYHLTSLTHRRRIRLEVEVPDADPRIPSVMSVYPTADWHERETYDMFGIVFTGRTSLTRILMPDDWPGHPQRKDYPLGGIPVEYKGAQILPPDERRAYN
ncbi:MAG: NADH-quinone oxidoreductase subunit C [Actinomycetes bacterium]